MNWPKFKKYLLFDYEIRSLFMALVISLLATVFNFILMSEYLIGLPIALLVLSLIILGLMLSRIHQLSLIIKANTKTTAKVINSPKANASKYLFIEYQFDSIKYHRAITPASKKMEKFCEGKKNYEVMVNPKKPKKFIIIDFYN